MNPIFSLHHCAKRVAPNSLDFMIELFAKLDCEEKHWDEGGRWAMIEQKGKDMIVQFIQTDQKPQCTEVKRDSHIAFLSAEPKESIASLRRWVESKGVRFEDGSWSDKELYFDCPEIFVDFVIEIMHTSIVE